MRNISLEAAKMAENNLIAQRPMLANKRNRQALTFLEKLAIFQFLIESAEVYENKIIQDLRSK